MHYKKTALLFLIILSITGCNCTKSYMPETSVAKPNDKAMNCKQLIYAMNDVEFQIKNVNERCAQPYIFAEYIPCTPMVKMNAAKNEQILWDRLEYLQTLYGLKGCVKIPLNKGTIQRNSKKIGVELIKLQAVSERKSNNTMIGDKAIIDLPINQQPFSKNIK